MRTIWTLLINSQMKVFYTSLIGAIFQSGLIVAQLPTLEANSTLLGPLSGLVITILVAWLLYKNGQKKDQQLEAKNKEIQELLKKQLEEQKRENDRLKQKGP